MLHLLKKAIARHGVPETITIDGSEANAAAIRTRLIKSSTTLRTPLPVTWGKDVFTIESLAQT